MSIRQDQSAVKSIATLVSHSAAGSRALAAASPVVCVHCQGRGTAVILLDVVLPTALVCHPIALPLPAGRRKTPVTGK